MNPIQYQKIDIICPRDGKLRALNMKYVQNASGLLIFEPFHGCDYSSGVEPCPQCIAKMMSLLTNATFTDISRPMNPLNV